jgi:hypothetical protein
MTETMIVMSFLLLMVFGFVHFAMLAATKSVVNLSAFASARAAMVHGWSGSFVSPGYLAAVQILDNTRWNNVALNLPFPYQRTTLRERDGVLVTYRVPFGRPIFNSVPLGGLAIEGFAPMAVQPNIPEEGDNAAQ